MQSVKRVRSGGHGISPPMRSARLSLRPRTTSGSRGVNLSRPWSATAKACAILAIIRAHAAARRQGTSHRILQSCIFRAQIVRSSALHRRSQALWNPDDSANISLRQACAETCFSPTCAGCLSSSSATSVINIGHVRSSKWIGINQVVKKGGAADEPTFRKTPPAAPWRRGMPCDVVTATYLEHRHSWVCNSARWDALRDRRLSPCQPASPGFYLAVFSP
jgi:hypothetical protein